MTSINTLLEASEGGVIPVKLEDDVVRFRIGHLYANPESAVRELYANELRACRTARDKYHITPRIEITLNVPERSLAIHGINSTGISEEKFLNVLAVLGESDNTDGSELGQFGWGVACVSEDTECLTRNGWKKRTRLKIGELIASYDLNTNRIEYQPLQTIHKYQFSGTLFEIGGGRKTPSLLTTINHRNVITRLNTPRQKHPELPWGHKGNLPRIRLREEMIVPTSDFKREDNLRINAIHNYPTNSGVGSKELAALIGWAITDGGYAKPTGRGLIHKKITNVHIYQKTTGQYTPEIRRLLKTVGAKWREWHSHPTKIDQTPMTTFSITGKVGLEIRTACPAKKLNRFLSELPRNELKTLFDAMLKGDGTKRGSKHGAFIQKAKVTTDWFQIIALRLGYYGVISSVLRGEHRINYVHLSKRHFMPLYQGHNKPLKVKPITYRGIVWCPQVQNGAWVARRKGKSIITGNSYTSLSDTLLYETRCMETGAQFAMLGIGGDHFSKLTQPNLDFPGTRATVHVRAEVNIHNIRNAIVSICAYSDINTRLKTIEAGGTEGPTIINEPELAYTLPHGTKVKIDTDDYQFIGALTPWPQQQSGEVRLLRMPIDATLQLPFDAFILDIKNERKFKPTADRERLTDQAVEHFQADITARLKEILPPVLEIGSFDDFRQKLHQYVYLKGYSGSYEVTKRPKVWDLCPPSKNTERIMRLLSIQVITTNQRGKQERPFLGNLVARSKNIFLVKSLDSNLLTLLNTRHSDAVLFKLDDGRSNSLQGAALESEICQQPGIRTDAEAEAKDIREELSRSKTYKPMRRDPILDAEQIQVVVHRSETRSFEKWGSEHYAVSDKTWNLKLSYANDRTIFVPEIERYLPVLTQIYSKGELSLSRLDKIPVALRSKVKTLEKFVKHQEAVRVATSKGEMTCKAIAESSDAVTIMAYDDPSMALHYDGRDMLVAVPPKEAAELALFLTAKGKAYTAQHIPNQAALLKITDKDDPTWSLGYQPETFDEDTNWRVNMVYHVALAVKDKRLQRLFIAAAENKPDSSVLLKLRNFVLQHDRKQP